MFAEDHPDVLETRHSLAVMRGEAGDPHAAIAELRRLRPDVERILGPGHPRTVKVIEDLGDWYGAAGDTRAAIETYRGLIAHVEQHLGAGHVVVLPALDKFAMWQGCAGSPEEAVRVLTRMLSVAQQVLDSDDPTIPVIKGNLAFWRAQVGGPGRGGCGTHLTGAAGDGGQVRRRPSANRPRRRERLRRLWCGTWGHCCCSALRAGLAMASSTGPSVTAWVL